MKTNMFKTPEEKPSLCLRCKVGYAGVVNTVLNDEGLCYPCEIDLRKEEYDKSHINQIRINDIEEEIKRLEDMDQLNNWPYVQFIKQELAHKRSQLEILQGKEK